MQRRFWAIFSLLTLLAAGCGGAQETVDEEGGGEAAGAQTYSVNVDGKSDKFNLATLAYFPKELSVHPGDTIEFKEVFTGEPHTVTFGKLVDAGLAAVDKAGPPGEGGPSGPPPPEMQKLPDIFGPPPTFDPLNQSAAQPCFIEAGDPPVSPTGGAPACPKADQPEFSGSQNFYNSGYLAEDETFTVKFAENAKPGSYNFMCLVHREMMRGKVTVAGPEAAIPSPDEVEEKGREQLAKTEDALSKTHEDMQKATAENAFAGGGSQAVMDALVAEFGPEEVSVPTGGTVTWNVFLFHTIALNPPEDAIVDLIQESDGTVRQNEKAVTPSKAPNPPPIVFGPGGKPSTVEATWDGTGYFNSGTMASFPGAEVTYKIRFTKAGTYQLQCTLHPEMEGTVKVG